MGAPGCATHLFDHLAVLSFAGEDADPVLELLLEAEVDVQDVESEAGQLTVFAPAGEFFKAKQALLDRFEDLKLEVEEIAFIPQSRVEIGSDEVPMFEKFMDMLNDCEDVQDIYHNAALPK